VSSIEHLPNLNSSLPFSSAVCIGDWIILSGEIGIDERGCLAVGLEAQMQRALDNIETTLRRLGHDRSAIVKCTLMLEDMNDWANANVVYLKFFEGLPLPARSAFGCAGLALGAKLELECLAFAQARP
jgi:enamine deaminase RidA (YjgF/YER057c/UK114 family)